MNIEKYVDIVLNWLATSGIKLVIALILLWIGFKIIKLFCKKTDRILAKRNFDPTLRSFMEAFVEMSLKILLVIFLIQYVGGSIAGLAALLASAGLAIGLALQGSLSNFAGGVIILFIRPFKVGDFIETNGYSGTVEHIRIFYTHLVTPDNKEILIPNGTLANGSLINYSSKATRRVDFKFGVSYNDDIIKVRRVLQRVIDNEPLILKHPEPFIGLSEHGQSSINFVVRVWCNSPDYFTIYFNIMEKVKLRFDEEGIEIPFPQMELNVKDINKANN